ncbi:hypothetical protein HHK36_028505 [Tetracentron sinense]|uniref:Uncharacterized protein n=1 Tax=Tetracentron sinense TaxID=13715 RepID=A0A835D3I6_TETSI|nr:hypothetical protein HHK36_028505 [Tetracentron sinense]
MLSSKSKSGLSEASHNKTSPATPRISKLGRGVAKSDPDSPSPLQNRRLSIDRSPRSVDSKPAVDRRSPKIVTPPDKPQPRGLKGSELQAQLGVVQEDLNKSKEQLASVEKEKAEVLEELKEAKRLAEEANEKLGEALVAQKRAEDSSEIEKFRADELEQAGIEATQKREEEWQKELEAIRNQHAVDVSALLSTTQEFQRVKQELAMTVDAKNQALSHADDATKIAEIHAEKMEFLSAELGRLKVLLESKQETEARESNEMIKNLNSEVDTLKQELEKANTVKDKLGETEASIGQLRIEMDTLKKAESDAGKLADEWRKKAEELETRVVEANHSERSASESVASLMKQLEGNSGLLQEAESEVASLRAKVELLEISIERQRGDLEKSERCFDMAKQEASEMGMTVESLKSELEGVKEEKMQALNNEKLAALSIQSLLEEKNKLITELEASRDEEEKSKKAMESLASALHEVSLEAREAKEKLLSIQADLKKSETQMEDLNLVLKATNEKYEAALDEAKHEIDHLLGTVEQSKLEIQNFKDEWDQKELHLMTGIKKSEEETSSIKGERERLVSLLKEAEEDACAAKEEGAQLQNTLNEAESEVTSFRKVVEEAKAESMRLMERLLDKENELQSISQENKELRTREAAALNKAEELSKLLEEASARKKSKENGELSDSEKDYDLLPKVVEFSEENGDGREEEKSNPELPFRQLEEPREDKSREDKNLSRDAEVPFCEKLEKGNETTKEEENKYKEDDSVEVEAKMWESCKIGDEKDFSPEREAEPESFEEELDSKVDGESFDQSNGLTSSENLDNGGSSPSKQQQLKKKKPLLQKFGSLLKKKGSSNHK